MFDPFRKSNAMSCFLNEITKMAAGEGVDTDRLIRGVFCELCALGLDPDSDGNHSVAGIVVPCDAVGNHIAEGTAPGRVNELVNEGVE